jgi:hypothetical protein
MQNSGSESPTAATRFDFEKLMRGITSVDRTMPLRQQFEQSRRLLLSCEKAFFSRAFLELLTRPYSENLERAAEIALYVFVFNTQKGVANSPQSSDVIWDVVTVEAELSQTLFEVACTFDKPPLTSSHSTSSPKVKQFSATLFSSLIDKLLSPTSQFRRAASQVVFESPHPYPDSSDVVHKIKIPGAIRLEISFDERSKTESGNDYVRFHLPDGKKVGDDKYTGRGDSARWAGVGGQPPLVVEGGDLEARFHSDGSDNDWGYKFTVVGILADNGFPCLRQRLLKPMLLAMCNYIMLESDTVIEPKESLVAKFACLEKVVADKETSAIFSHFFSTSHPAKLRHFVCNVMFRLHSATSEFFRDAGRSSISLKSLGADLRLDLETSLRTLMTLQQSTPKQTSFESPHPYPDNSDVVHKISVPGASRLEIVFDPQSKTEKNHDYVRFVLPDGRVVGEDKYTGRGDSAHWAGVNGTPALVVEGSEVEARFHSDGSNNDWGLADVTCCRFCV